MPNEKAEIIIKERKLHVQTMSLRNQHLPHANTDHSHWEVVKFLAWGVDGVGKFMNWKCVWILIEELISKEEYLRWHGNLGIYWSLVGHFGKYLFMDVGNK